MIPRATRQVLGLLLCSGLLLGLLGQLNHTLAPRGLTLATPGLIIGYAALRLPLRPGLAAVLFAGLWIDAATPVLFGRHALLYGLAFCLVYNLRDRLPREETLVGVVAALFINLGLFVVAALLDLGGLPDPASAGLRLLLELVFSQALTALAGPWFIAFQSAWLTLFHARPEPTVRRFA